MRRVIGLSGVVALFVAAPVTGQSVPSFELTPSVGLFLPQNAVGPAAPVGAWFLRLEQPDPAFALGLSAQANWSSQVSTRVGVLAVLPTDVKGQFECRPGTGCPSVLLINTAEASVVTAMADVIVAPVQVHPSIRPYLMVGAGVRREHYNWPDTGELIDNGTHTESALTFRVGLGVEVALLGSALRVELENHRSPEGSALFEDPLATEFGSPRRRAQTDLGLTLGWPLLRF